MGVEDCLTNAKVTDPKLREIALSSETEKIKNEMITVHEASAKLRLRQAKQQRTAIEGLKKEVEALEERGISKEKIMNDMMSGSGARGLGIVSLERRIEAVLSPVHRKLGGMMEAYKTRKLGLPASKAGQRNFVKEVFKQGSSGDADAQQFAKAWKEVTDDLRTRYNNAGGSIKWLQDWNLPQSHDATRVGKVSFEQWYGDIEPLIRRNRIGKGIKDEDFRKVMQSVYENLKTDGNTPINTKFLPAIIRKKLGNRHQEHRLLHFKDGDAWMAYSDKYGAQDYFNSMMGYTEMMAREIAALERFGPNADAVVDMLLKPVKGRTAINTYNEMMGKNYGFNNKFGDVMQSLRNYTVGTKIGGALIPALTDQFFTALTAKFNGMPMVKTMMKGFARLNPSTNAGDKQLLNQIGLLGEYALNRARTANRLSEVYGYGVSAKFADASVRLSGLNYWTQTLKENFQLEFAANLGRLTDNAFTKLPKRVRNSLDRYGISDVEWDYVRTNELFEKDGAKFFDISKIDDPEMTAKFVGMIKEETSFAVPEPTAKVKAILHAGLQKGTLAGEMVRSLTQFKAFPTAMMLSHMHRLVNMSAPDALTYGAAYMVGGTALGMGIVQTKELLSGKTPREVDASLVRDGMLQAGLTSWIGDLLIDDPTAFGGVPKRLLGPVLADGFDATKYLWGTAAEVYEMENGIMDALESRVPEGISLARRQFPGKFWWSKLALDRYVLDQAEKALNPNWRKKQRRLEKRLNKQGQETWSNPGTPLHRDINIDF